MRPIAYIDTECTGLDTVKDAIFNLAVHVPDMQVSREWLLKPWKPIPKDVEELTGITNERVKDCPMFKDRAAEIHSVLIDFDLAGFNVKGYDIPIIFEELARSNIIWDLSKTLVIDHGNIFKIREKRDLSKAVQFYCNVEHKDAHGAMADCIGTHRVALGQLMRYPDLFEMTREQLAAASEYEGPKKLSWDGKIIEGEDGEPVYNFGKYYGAQMKVRHDISYAEWMMKGEFPAQTKIVLGKLMQQYSDEAAAKRAPKSTQKALL
jgi:DNA polymerase-3 subunit epsilon